MIKKALKIISLILLLVISFSGCLKDPASIQPGIRCKIAYYTDVLNRVFIVNGDGSHNQGIGFVEGRIFALDWFPDGNFIIYSDVSTDGYTPDTTVLRIYNVNTGNQVDEISLITLANFGINYLDVSPDGEKIAFQFIDPSTGIGRIAYLDLLSRKIHILTAGTDTCGAPLWSRKEDKIIFEKWDKTNQYEIYSINLDGSNLLNLTKSVSNDLDPVFSPDGNQIAYVAHGRNKVVLYIMDSDGNNKRALYTLLLSTGSEFILQPDWSPDGQFIALIKKPGDNGMDQIFIMDIEKQDIEQVSHEVTGALRKPLWLGSNEKLIYSSNDRGLNIFAIDLKTRKRTTVVAKVDGAVWDYKVAPNN